MVYRSKKKYSKNNRKSQNKGGNPFQDSSLSTETSILPGERLTENTVAFHPNKNMAAVVAGRKAYIWSFQSDGSQPVLLNTIDEIPRLNNCVSFHPNGNVLAIGYNDENIRLWRLLKNGSDAACVKTLPGHTQGVICVAFHPNGQFLASGSNDNSIKLWRISHDGFQGWYVNTLLGHTQAVYSLAFHPTMNLLVSSSVFLDKTVKLWRFESDGTNPQCTFTLSPHKESVNCVVFHQSGNYLLTCSNDHSVKLWRFLTRDSEPVCVDTLLGHTGPVCSGAFHPSGKFILTGSKDNTAKLWQFQSKSFTYKCIDTLSGHTNWITSVAFNVDGNLLATGSKDGSVKLSNSSKIHEYLRSQALIHGVLSTKLIKAFTREPTQQLSDMETLILGNRVQKRIGNLAETRFNRDDARKILRQKYLELRPPGEAMSQDTAQQFYSPQSLVPNVKKTASHPLSLEDLRAARLKYFGQAKSTAVDVDSDDVSSKSKK